MEGRIQVLKGPFNILQLAQDKRTQFPSPGLETQNSQPLVNHFQHSALALITIKLFEQNIAQSSTFSGAVQQQVGHCRITLHRQDVF